MTSQLDNLKSVWVLSKGEYSDYRVLAVVNGTKREAEVLAARANATETYGEYRVEEMDVVSPKVDRVEILNLMINVWDNGKTSDDRTWVNTEWPFDAWDYAVPVLWRWVRAPIHQNRGGRLEVRGTDHAAVRRVFDRQLARLIAGDPLHKKNRAEGKR